MVDVHVHENNYDFQSDAQNAFFQPNWVAFNIPDKRTVFNTTGSVDLDNLENQADRNRFVGDRSEEWKGTFLYLDLSLPNFYSPTANTFRVEGATPFVTISGIDKGGDNHNGGWQIYNFGVVQPVRRLPVTGANGFGTYETISIWAHIAVRGTLFKIWRVAYSLMITGFIVQIPPIQPPR